MGNETNNPLLVIVGEKLLELRTANNMSQLDVAERLGVGQTIVAYWEKGQREIKATTVNEICNIFNVTPNYLMGYEDSIVLSDNEVLRFSKFDVEILKEIQNNKEFMKLIRENTPDKINMMLKLYKSVTTIIGK